MESLQKYFGEIDVDFIGIKKTTDDVYVYNATDVLVQSTWELPIVIQWPESTVKFEFSCDPSDITFGIVFVAAPEEDHDLEDLEIETIEEMGRVDSAVEPVTGSFEVPCEGVVFFLFDNNYDWTANKKITYLIEVMQPSFSLPDQLRTERVRPVIKDVVEELDVAYIRHADAQDCSEHSAANVYFLEEQVAALQSKLAGKREELARLDAVMLDAQEMLVYGYSAMPGLCIRMLNKHLLRVVLGYLYPRGGANVVCKYWAELGAANRKSLAAGPEKVYREPKMSQSDISAALFQIRLNADNLAAAAAAAAQQTAIENSQRRNYGSNNNASVEPYHGSAQYHPHGHSSSATKPHEFHLKSNASALRSGGPGGSPVKQQQQQKPRDSAVGPTSKKGKYAVSDDDSGLDSDLQEEVPVRRPGEQPVQQSAQQQPKVTAPPATTALAVTSGKQSTTTPAKPAAQPAVGRNATIAEEPSAALRRVNSGRSSDHSRGVQVSYDNLLPQPPLNPSFTTAVNNVLSPFEKDKRAPAASCSKQQQAVNSAMPQQLTPQQQHQWLQQLEQQQVQKQQKEKEKELSKSTHSSRLTSYIEANSTRRREEEPALEPPKIAESKRMVRKSAAHRGEASPGGKPQRTSVLTSGGVKHRESAEPEIAAAAASAAAGKQTSRSSGADKHLLQHVKNIRSEKQMRAMLDYISAQLAKAEDLAINKRRVKKLIRAWTASYEKKTGRLPTSNERKGHLRELYEEYQQVSLALRIRTDKIDEILTSVGLDRDSFEKLRNEQS